MAKPITLHRIICTITGKALVAGSNFPHHHLSLDQFSDRYNGLWFERGQWTERGGCFWKNEEPVRAHLQNLCHDWRIKASAFRPRASATALHWGLWPASRYTEVIPGSLDWSRLNFLMVELIHVVSRTSKTVIGSDFMGIEAKSGAI